MSPEAQESAIRAYAARMDLEIAEIITDAGTSGGAPLHERPKLADAIDALKAHKAAVFLVAKRDRLARDVFRAAFVDRLVARVGADFGARVESADGVAGGESPEEKLLRTMLDAFGEYERAMIQLRTRAVLRAKAKKGERIGQVPYGSKLVGATLVDGVLRGGSLVPEPREQAAIAFAKRRRDEGASWNLLVAELQQSFADAARGQRWHKTTVVRMIAPPKT